MNWRLTVVLIVAFSIALFATFMVFYLISRGAHLSYHTLTRDVVMGISGAFGSLGFSQLKRAGKRKLAWVFIGSALTLICISLLCAPLFRRPLSEYVADFIVCPGYLLFAAQLPLALYLNRKQSYSASQPTVTKVS